MKRGLAWGIAALAGWMAACRFVPGLAAGWQGTAGAAMMGLHRATAAVPFPVAEPMALAVPWVGAGKGGLRRAALTLCAVVGVYALMWYPAYWAEPSAARPRAGAEALERLCLELAAEMGNAPDFDGAPGQAGAVAGLDGVVVKAARYPEWMRALGIAGLFSPWTGEAIVDAAAPPACVPFTCVHELMHLKGIADEGAANIAAYRACVAWGGCFAWSARLWALRSALTRLSEADDAAARRVVASLTPPLNALIDAREAAAGPNPVARCLGIAAQTTDYDALADWLAGAEQGKCGRRIVK